MRLLALGAHPDDIEIYMFGTLAAAVARGDDVVLAIVTDGAAGGGGDPAELRRTRQAEASVAARLLGLTPRFLGFSDGTLIADAGLVATLRSIIVETAPDLVITHAPNDYHGDHRALSDAVRIAAGFTAPVLWADNMQGAGFVPTHYVDITGHFATKVEAIRAHASQDPERFVIAAERLNAFRASQANGWPPCYAEAFRFEPSFPFVDIRELLPPAPPLRPVSDRRKPRGPGHSGVCP